MHQFHIPDIHENNPMHHFYLSQFQLLTIKFSFDPTTTSMQTAKSASTRPTGLECVQAVVDRKCTGHEYRAQSRSWCTNGTEWIRTQCRLQKAPRLAQPLVMSQAKMSSSCICSNTTDSFSIHAWNGALPPLLQLHGCFLWRSRTMDAPSCW
jgi:hypothetical protein